jgi:hypothetical protein
MATSECNEQGTMILHSQGFGPGELPFQIRPVPENDRDPKIRYHLVLMLMGGCTKI